jgi:hypothetical protein
MEKCCCGKMISRIPTFETLTMLSFLKHHFLNPLKELLHDSKTIGIGLLCCTVVSLLLSNYSLTNINYIHFWNNSFVENHQQHLRIGIIQLPNSILQIINDFLMTIDCKLQYGSDSALLACFDGNNDLLLFRRRGSRFYFNN